MYLCLSCKCLGLHFSIHWTAELFSIHPAPPKCLDEDDVEHFRQVDERHKKYLENQKQMDDKQLEEFRKNSQQQIQQPTLKIHCKKEETKKPAPAIGKTTTSNVFKILVFVL